jgi:general stress protein 26
MHLLRKERTLMKKPLCTAWALSAGWLLLVSLASMAPAAETGARSKPPSSANRDSLIAAAREIMGLQTYCALVTVDSAGLPQIRTMNPFPPEPDMTVWMATNTLSRKIREIRNNPRVCLYYADHKAASGYVAISGKAVLVEDQAEKLRRKRAYWDQAFPEGKNLILIKVIPERIDLLNYKRGLTNDPATWRTPSIEFKNPSP